MPFIVYHCSHHSRSVHIIPGLFQNATIEERVSLLEIQVVEIEEDVTGLGVDLTELEGDVNFLFDETVIKNERIYSLEQTSIEIDEEVEGKKNHVVVYMK